MCTKSKLDRSNVWGKATLRTILSSFACPDATPMGRYGTPDDVAGAVIYLASPAASWVTGEVIRIAGGMGGD